MYHGNCAAWVTRWIIGRDAVRVWNIRQSAYDLTQEKLGTRAMICLCAHLPLGVAHILYNSEAARRQQEAVGYRMDLGKTVPNGFEMDVFRPDPEASVRLRAALGVPA